MNLRCIFSTNHDISIGLWLATPRNVNFVRSNATFFIWHVCIIKSHLHRFAFFISNANCLWVRQKLGKPPACRAANACFLFSNSTESREKTSNRDRHRRESKQHFSRARVGELFMTNSQTRTVLFCLSFYLERVEKYDSFLLPTIIIQHF